jgi:STE24 endopeptidase
VVNESKATRYQRLRRRAQAAGIASAALMLGIVAFSPLAARLGALSHEFARGLPAPWASAASLAIFVLLVVVLWELASLPAVIYLARRVDRLYGQNVPSIEEALGAQAQATAIALPAAYVVGSTIVAAVHVAGTWWWAAAGFVLALALAATVRAAPAALALVADVRPLTRPQLQARLAELVRRAGLPGARIDEWVIGESSRTTALVVGLGGTRRVLVSSELVRHWSDDEITVVVAHELGHHVHNDLWRTLALEIGVLGASLFAADAVIRLTRTSSGLTGPADLAALPTVALVAGAVWTLATPIRHAQSRRQERRADHFALALTGGVDAFGTAIRRLGTRLLAEERPSVLTRWLFHRHPSVAERLALADAFRKRG